MSELGPETHELLRKARQGTPAVPPEVRKRVRGAVMAGAGGSTIVAGVSFAKVVVIGVVSASLGSVATLVVTKPSVVSHQQAPEAARVVPPIAKPPALEAVEAPDPVEVVPSTPAVAPVRAELRPRMASIPAASPNPPAQADTIEDHSLTAELETLEGILRATDVANWPDARVRLGAYFSRFEDGHLRTEAQALEVLTLCGEDRVEAARALRQELLAAEPLNPAVLRLSTSCAAK